MPLSLALKLALSPVLVLQALRTRARLPRLPEADGERSGRVGDGPRLRLLVAGDSSAAGVGVAAQSDALAVRLAGAIAAAAGLAVDWRLVARSGVTTAQTLELLRAEALGDFDVAVVVTGVNDVVDRVPPARALAARAALADWLRASLDVGHVVFAALPPVHQFPGLPQPLRWIAGRDARRHDAALERWCGGRADVSRAEIGVALDRTVMAVDGFHPAAPVYAACAEAIARHVAQRGIVTSAGRRPPASAPPAPRTPPR